MSAYNWFIWKKALPIFLGFICVLLAFVVGPYELHVLSTAVIFAVLFLSVYLVGGLLGQVSLCHGALFGIGAYTAGIVSIKFDSSFPVAVLAACFATALCGLLISLPLIRLKEHYFALGTIGFSEIASNVFRSATDLTGGGGGLEGITRPTIIGIDLSGPQRIYLMVIAVAGASIWLSSRLVSSKLGLRLRALRDNEIVAESCGINGPLSKIGMWILSSGVAGLAGALFAFQDRFVGPESFSTGFSILIYCALVLAGRTHLLGALAAAVMLVVGREYLREFDAWQGIFFGGGVILVMILFPSGILGWLLRRPAKSTVGNS